MRLALFQPDIPQNTGALMRIGACFRVPVDIIEPCGFPFDDKRLRRTAMGYGGASPPTTPGRGGLRVLLTTAASVSFADFAYPPADVLLLGRESAGVPDFV